MFKIKFRSFLFTSAPMLTALCASAQAQAPIELSLKPEYSTIAPSENSLELHVLIKIDAATMPGPGPKETRQPINLGLTLDTSGSMSEAAK